MGWVKWKPTSSTHGGDLTTKQPFLNSVVSRSWPFSLFPPFIRHPSLSLYIFSPLYFPLSCSHPPWARWTAHDLKIPTLSGLRLPAAGWKENFWKLWNLFQRCWIVLWYISFFCCICLCVKKKQQEQQRPSWKRVAWDGHSLGIVITCLHDDQTFSLVA